MCCRTAEGSAEPKPQPGEAEDGADKGGRAKARLEGSKFHLRPGTPGKRSAGRGEYKEGARKRG